ncbi:MAG TPA: metallophosphoesterase [Gammaproteobacteria bacterium]
MRRLLVVGAACAALCAAGAVAQESWRAPAAPRVVVVPDVHGAYGELVALLVATGLVDDELAWTGGDTVLVSLGDLLDRGGESRKVIDLLMRLQQTAPARGGAVHVLLGNHEAMNLIGDLRYVSPAEYAAFAADEPPELRERAYAEFVRLQTEPLPEAASRAAFAERYPPGFFAHRAAFAPDGVYGSWLLTLPAMLVIGDTAFVHGGVSAHVGEALQVGEDVNARIRGRLLEYLDLRARLASPAPPELRGDLEARSEALARLALGPDLGSASPMWYRGTVYCNPLLEAPVLDAALEGLGAERLVVGHTPTADRRARALYDGRVIMLDTGMLAQHYGGRPAALVIEPGGMHVRYGDSAAPQPLERGRIEAYGLTDDELRRVLASGGIELEDGSRDLDPAPARVRRGASVVAAVVYRERAAAELAAHALDRRLGLNLVPPTAARTVDGRTVAVQLRYPDAVTEAERIERRVPLGEYCPLEAQWQLLWTFDALAGNTSRTPENVLYLRETSALKAIEHGRAFGSARSVRLPDGFSLPDEARAALAAFDESAAHAVLDEWLDERRIRALLARRNALLETR